MMMIFENINNIYNFSYNKDICITYFYRLILLAGEIPYRVHVEDNKIKIN